MQTNKFEAIHDMILQALKEEGLSDSKRADYYRTVLLKIFEEIIGAKFKPDKPE